MTSLFTVCLNDENLDRLLLLIIKITFYLPEVHYQLNLSEYRHGGPDGGHQMSTIVIKV